VRECTPSKLYAENAVPATLLTLTAPTPSTVLAAPLMHASVVADVHPDVPHVTISRAAVALGSAAPKLSPVTVREPPPLSAPLGSTAEAIAASNDKMPAFVPLMALTVTCMLTGYPGTAPVRHATPVAEIHDDVAHKPRATPVVALVSATPNASPATVTELAPDSGKLSITAEAIAMSKLKTGADVPATPPTLTADSPNIVLVGLL
jgi:hypothetical protein